MQCHHQETSHERHPLISHISLSQQESFEEHEKRQMRWVKSRNVMLLIFAIGAVILFTITFWENARSQMVPIERAKEHTLDIGNELTLWYRVWGNRESGVPVLFVHGGPGNCIDDYHNENARFFAAHRFFVVEVDQRGTGRSQPSVRDDCRNMEYYSDISIDQMSHDYEVVREALQIERWLVFGGSWGSTLSLDYAERYPESCLGLILRGIWLNTRPEFDSIFTRRAYLSNKERLEWFDMWFELAAEEAERTGEQLDPNDGEQFFRIYGRMIQRCNEHAIWRHFVWENNLMEEDPANLLDPYKIAEDVFPEATSVAFFENRLFLYGTFDKPMDLLEKVDRLKHVNIWICQGLHDEVCPAKFGAQRLADALESAGVTIRSQFLDGGHESSDPVIAQCLEDSVADFLKKIHCGLRKQKGCIS